MLISKGKYLLIGFIIVSLSFYTIIKIKKDENQEIFSIEEFSNYREFVHSKDSLILKKRFLINNTFRDLNSLSDTLKTWSESNSPISLLNDKTTLIKYSFYNKKAKKLFGSKIDSDYLEDGGLWSDSFGDENNPLFAEIEWKYYKENNKVRKIISLIEKNNIRFESNRTYLNYNQDDQ